jgi:hypothetical protein
MKESGRKAVFGAVDSFAAKLAEKIPDRWMRVRTGFAGELIFLPAT